MTRRKYKRLTFLLSLLVSGCIVIFFSADVFAHGHESGNSGGTSTDKPVFNVEETIMEQLDFGTIDTESQDKTEITISMDGPVEKNEITEQDIAEIVDYTTTFVEYLPFAGGIAIAYVTAGWSIPLSAFAGGAYAYGTSRLSGKNRDDSTQSGLNSFAGGFAPGGPPGQTIAGEILNQMQQHGHSDSAPVNSPHAGAELNSTTGQVTQR